MNVARRLQLSSLLSIKHDSNEDDNLSTHRCRQMASVEIGGEVETLGHPAGEAG